MIDFRKWNNSSGEETNMNVLNDEVYDKLEPSKAEESKEE